MTLSHQLAPPFIESDAPTLTHTRLLVQLNTVRLLLQALTIGRIIRIIIAALLDVGRFAITLSARIILVLAAIDLPAIDLPAIDLPAIDLPAIDLLAIDLPAIDLPAIDLLAIDLPAIDLLAIDLPAIDLPAIDLPAIDLPAIDLPAIDLPAIDLPAIDLDRLDLLAGSVGSDTSVILDRAGVGTSARNSVPAVGAAGAALAVFVQLEGVLAVVGGQVVAGEVWKLDPADGFAGFVTGASGTGGLGADVGGGGWDDAGGGGGRGGRGSANAGNGDWAADRRVGGQAVGLATLRAGAGVCAIGGDVLAEVFEFAAGW